MKTVTAQRLIPWFSLMILFLCACGADLYAQGTTGNITGEVVDPSGLGIPGVHVTAINTETNLPTSTTSTSSGNFNISVYPGTYRVTVEAQGFKRYARDGVTVTASTTVRI